ncbi:glycosyltransferase [Pedobacter sp. Hv1]|uniref:glycosyltransferase n=1 Tax=Pedobacter sp. Hv1 TaxID=1740090 RepID=UPI0006D89F81|nr:glycosyltransferase [Pedobacter sp. Hv1]KQB99420.1 hypothetical protein AQF98_17780 [Pedobacter sp. Hv1]
MTNLILFSADKMQGFFGLGSHMEELINYFRKKEDIYITIVFTASDKYPECTFVQKDGIDMIYVPCPENRLLLSMEDSLPSNTLALRVLQIVYPFLKDKEKLVCWFNSLAELNLLKRIKDFLDCKILYVHHAWGWKDFIRVEDAVFIEEWKKGNDAFCEKAFQSIHYQLQMAEHSDYTITVTRQAEKYFNLAFGISASKLVTIYNGIKPPRLSLINKGKIRHELGIADNEEIILFSGRVVENKGVLFLVDAFKQLLKKKPNCRLVLIGTGSLNEVLKAALPTWGKLTLTGIITREWVQKWYAIANVGILPSLMEQCSYTAIEMRFWKIPLIISAVDGLDEVFQDNVDCLKIPVTYDQNKERVLSPIQIENCLYRLLTDKIICEKIVKNGYKKAFKQFTANEMGQSYYKVITQLYSST